MSTNDNAHVSFNNDVDVEEAAPVAGNELSQSEKAWDLDGDGKLSNTEKALKDIDKTGKGTLSKDQMHSLMHQNLALQKDLSKVKKFVIALTAVTVLLALANVGVAFAAAYLAKDTKTEGGKLVVVGTGEAVQTDSMTTVFEVTYVPDESGRRLGGCNGGDGLLCDSCGSSLFGECQSAISKCRAGQSVSFNVRQDGTDVVALVYTCNPGQDQVYYESTGSLDVYADGGTTTNSLTLDPSAQTCYWTLGCKVVNAEVA